MALESLGTWMFIFGARSCEPGLDLAPEVHLVVHVGAGRPLGRKTSIVWKCQNQPPFPPRLVTKMEGCIQAAKSSILSATRPSNASMMCRCLRFSEIHMTHSIRIRNVRLFEIELKHRQV
jgi:hypothetical protein